MVDEDEVRRRLEQIDDPCSTAIGRPMNIVEMGLLREVKVDGADIHVIVGVTTPLCHMVPYFMQQVDILLAGLPGVGKVTCDVDQSAGWTPEEMSAEARRRMTAIAP